MEPFVSGPEQFAAFIKVEIVKYARIIKAANIRIEHLGYRSIRQLKTGACDNPVGRWRLPFSRHVAAGRRSVKASTA